MGCSPKISKAGSVGEAIPLGFSADGAMQLVCKITEKGNLKKKKKKTLG